MIKMIFYFKIFKFLFLIMATIAQLVMMALLGITLPKVCLLGITLICLSLTCEKLCNILSVVKKIK